MFSACACVCLIGPNRGHLGTPVWKFEPGKRFSTAAAASQLHGKTMILISLQHAACVEPVSDVWYPMLLLLLVLVLMLMLMLLLHILCHEPIFRPNRFGGSLLGRSGCAYVFGILCFCSSSFLFLLRLLLGDLCFCDSCLCLTCCWVCLYRFTTFRSEVCVYRPAGLLLHLAAVNAADKDAARKTAFRRPAIDLSQTPPPPSPQRPRPHPSSLFPSPNAIGRLFKQMKAQIASLVSRINLSFIIITPWLARPRLRHPAIPLALNGEGP